MHAIYGIRIETKIFALSGEGTPTDPMGRNKKLSPLLQWKWIASCLFGNAFLLVYGLLASLGYAQPYSDCRDILRQLYLDHEDDLEHSYYYYASPYESSVVADCNEHDCGFLKNKRALWLPLLLLILSQAFEFLVSSFALVSLLLKPKFVSKSPNHLVIECTRDGHISHNTSILDFTESHHNDVNNFSSHKYHHRHHELVEEMWDERCNSFCRCAAVSTCFLFGGKELMVGGDYKDISRALADYFEDGGVLDIVPSDIAAGFVALQNVQTQRVMENQRKLWERRKEGILPQFESDVRIDWSVNSGQTSFPLTHSLQTTSFDRVDFEINGQCSTSTTEMTAVQPAIISERMSGKQEKERKYKPEDRGSEDKSLDENLETISSHNVNLSQHSLDATAERQSSPEGNDHDETDKFFNSSTSSSLWLYPDASMHLGPLLDSNHDASALMHHLSLNQASNGKNCSISGFQNLLCKNNKGDRMALAEVARFARHALSIYTWVLYAYMYPGSGIPKLCAQRLIDAVCFSRDDTDEVMPKPTDHNIRCLQGNETSPLIFGLKNCACEQENKSNIKGDNFLHLHRNALLAQSGLDNADLIYADFNNKYHQMPYCIVIDHKWQSVVISIRGTLSLEDCVTDVLVTPVSLEELGRESGFNGSGQYCHNGIVCCTKHIYSSLQSHKILDRLLLADDAQYSHYNLRITGHSLGAGCATLLGYMMKNKYPNLRVINISPPGCSMSWEMATECKDFVTSLVLDSDLVPRLSIDTLERLRDDVLELLGRIRVPKMEIVSTFLTSGILGFFRKGSALDEDDGEAGNDYPYLIDGHNAHMFHQRESAPTNTEFHRQLERFKAIQDERKRQRGILREVQLYPPGRIMHLVKTGEKSSCAHAMAHCITCCTTNAGI